MSLSNLYTEITSANRVDSPSIGQSELVEHRAEIEDEGAWLGHALRLAPILLVYLGLAFFRIGHQSLWGDEVASVLVSHPQKSFFEVGIWELGSRPLYHTVLHLWANLGSSETILRSLSVLVGFLGVIGVYLLGLSLFNRWVAFIGTALFATSPFFIWYSQEVRYITLLITSSLFAMYAYHRVLSTNRLRWRLAYACSLIIAMGAFLTNVLVPIIHGLHLLFSPARRENFRKIVTCQILVLVLFIWWANEWQYRELGGYWNRLFHEITLEDEELKSVPKEERFSRGGDRPFELAAIPYTFFTLSVGFSLGPSVRELQMDRSLAALAPHAPSLLMAAILFGGLFIAGLIAVIRQRSLGIFIGLWLTVPVLAACVVAAHTHAAFNVRYVAMILPAYILLLAAGVNAIRYPQLRAAALASLFLINSVSLSNYYFDPRYARDDARSAAEYLESVAEPRDIIVVVGGASGLQYYYAGKSPIVNWKTLADNDQSRIERRLGELSQRHNRLWLVEIRPWQVDRKSDVRAMLERLYGSIAQRNFPGVDIYLYDP